MRAIRGNPYGDCRGCGVRERSHEQSYSFDVESAYTRYPQRLAAHEELAGRSPFVALVKSTGDLLPEPLRPAGWMRSLDATTLNVLFRGCQARLYASRWSLSESTAEDALIDPAMQKPVPSLRTASRWWETIVAAISEPKPVSSNRLATFGLAALACFWALLLIISWAKWGNVTIDCGREMYVAAEVSEGRTLYRDVWYLYGPLAPYFNGLLFTFFGAKLEVLYWAGSLSALICALLLYITGIRLGCWLAGFTAAAVLLGEAFAPGLFSFPLPYSFGTVYAAVASCVCLWCCVEAASSARASWVFAAASAAGLALLSKFEFGFGCAAAVATLIIGRGLQQPRFSRVARDLAVTLPAAAAVALTAVWMVSLGGADFLLYENLAGLPSTYFMQHYGAWWLRSTGLALDGRSLLRGAAAVLSILAFLACRTALRRYGAGWNVFFLGSAVLTGIAVMLFYDLHAFTVVARYSFFPPAMVCIVLAAVPLLAALAWRSGFVGRFLGLLVLALGAGTAAIRTALGTKTTGYSIYFNGPVVLAFLLLVGWLAIPRTSRGDLLEKPAQALPFLAVLIVGCLPVLQLVSSHAGTVQPLVTPRGLIYVEPDVVAPYDAAIRFMITAARAGEYTMTVPEDTSLYFFSGTRAPSRVYQFAPGLTVPGTMMNKVIAEIESKRVRYLIWSNRTFEEYGAREFGVDFDQPLGEYFRAHFHRLGHLPGKRWRATIWEHNPECRVK